VVFRSCLVFFYEWAEFNYNYRTLCNSTVTVILIELILIITIVFFADSWSYCDRKSRAACAQSFALWQQAKIEITWRDHSVIACSRHIYGVVLRAHSVRGEPRIQRNASGEVKTVHIPDAIINTRTRKSG